MLEGADESGESGVGGVLLALLAIGGLGAGLVVLARRKGLDPRLALQVEQEMWRERGERRQQVKGRVQRRTLEKQIKEAAGHLAALRQQLAQLG